MEFSGEFFWFGEFSVGVKVFGCVGDFFYGFSGSIVDGLLVRFGGGG